MTQQLPKRAMKIFSLIMSRLELYKSCCLCFPIENKKTIPTNSQNNKIRLTEKEANMESSKYIDHTQLRSIKWFGLKFSFVLFCFFTKYQLQVFLKPPSRGSRHSNTSVTGSRSQSPHVASSLDSWFTAAFPWGYKSYPEALIFGQSDIYLQPNTHGAKAFPQRQL